MAKENNTNGKHLEILPLDLHEDLFLGKGTHKECYRHPEDPSKCVKVAYNEGGTIDLVRETKYRKILERHHADTRILPRYYGVVPTNKGDGYVYELVRDCDGKPSKSLEDYLKDEDLLSQNFDMLVEQMKLFHQTIYTNSILTMALFPENIIVQKISTRGGQKYTFRLINDMGSALLIPLEYVFDFVAKKRVEKRWQQFLRRMHKWYADGEIPSPLVEKLLQKVEE